MGGLEVVTTADRHDLDEQARDALRAVWPEFIFHDPVSAEHIGRVETYFPQYDVLLLHDGQVVAGGWGVPIRWDGTVSRYPLAPMENFTRWTGATAFTSTPWIRTHQRLGASILASAPRSMIITGTVLEWEDWAAMAFPETGQYVVPDALDLVAIDREQDRGTYAETNLWMRHAYTPP